METDGGEVAPLRQIGGRPRLVPASSHGGEILKAATGAETSSRFGQRPPVAPIAPEFRPPAPTRRAPHRVKRRINNRPSFPRAGPRSYAGDWVTRSIRR